MIGLQREIDKGMFSPEERRLLDSLNDQTALAIERTQLAEKIDEAQIIAEADKLRVAMLTSLSHDLRTPLASILGAATTLLANVGLYDLAKTKDMLQVVREEAERLDRFVGNLLDMSRLEAGALGTKTEAIEISDALSAAVGRLSRRIVDRQVIEDIPDDIPFASADPLLLEQALVNILDNAIKYSPQGSAILVTARLGDGFIYLTIEDEGPGIADLELPHIFDKFYRIRKADKVAGTGLGLSVAKGFVEAFGGTLTARNRPSHKGAAFEIKIPISKMEVAP